MSQSLLPQDYWTVAGSQALAILVGNTKNLWAPFLSACAKVEGLMDETDPLDHYTELSLGALAQPRCRPDRTLLHSCIIGRCPAATSWVTCQGVAEGHVHDSCSCSCQISTISQSPQPSHPDCCTLTCCMQTTVHTPQQPLFPILSPHLQRPEHAEVQEGSQASCLTHQSAARLHSCWHLPPPLCECPHCCGYSRPGPRPVRVQVSGARVVRPRS